MLFKLHLPTLPKLFLFHLPKRSSMTIYTHLNQCCCSPVSAPSFFAAALAVAQCHGLGRQPAPSSRARWVHECQCWHHSTGSEPTAAGTLKWPSWWAVLQVPLLIRLFSLLQFTLSIIQNKNQNEGFLYSSTSSFTAHQTDVMPSPSTSTITSAGQIRFLHQPAGYISETLGLTTALVTAAASILQWNRLTQTSRRRNSNSAWKKQTHKQQQQNPYYNQVQKP